MKQSKNNEKEIKKQKRSMPLTVADAKPSPIAKMVFAPLMEVYGGRK